MASKCSSETSTDFKRTTRRYIPGDSTLRNHHCENLKCYILNNTEELPLHQSARTVKVMVIWSNIEFSRQLSVHIPVHTKLNGNPFSLWGNIRTDEKEQHKKQIPVAIAHSLPRNTTGKHPLWCLAAPPQGVEAANGSYRSASKAA
jgi:hypothetical protein